MIAVVTGVYAIVAGSVHSARAYQLAESLEVPLFTLDARIAKAAGHRAKVERLA